MKKKTWFELADHPEIRYGQYIVPNFISNTVAIQTAQNDWTLISPGESLLQPWLKNIAGPDARVNIVFPNHFHYLGVKAWLETYPEAKTYASPKAQKRLREKGFQAVRALDKEQPDLPQGYTFLIPPGHRGGDIWLTKRDEERGHLWITCDSFLNYDRVSNQPIARGLQKILGAAPGLKISQVIKWLLLDGRKPFKLWALEQLNRLPPETLIPSHGELAHGPDLALQLRELVESRL